MSAESKILGHLNDLYPHCKHYERRSPETIATLLNGYLNVLERRWSNLDRRNDVADWVGTVCEKWLDNIGDRKHEFPSAAQLRDLAEAYEPKEKTDAPKPWTEPCSAEEFDGMSLRDKARECRLRAIFYGDKAGGMDIKGNLIRPEAFARYHPEAEYWQAQGERFEGLVRQAKHTERPSHGLNPLAMAAPIARLG